MHHPMHVSIKLLLVFFFIVELECAILNNKVNITDNNINATNNKSLIPIIHINKNQLKEMENLNSVEARKKQEEGIMSRIMPLMVIPFMVSTAMIPMMLISLKFMLWKSAFIGKIAVLFMLLNMFSRRSEGQGGVFNHNVNEMEMSMNHYGYGGDEEYGAYINRKRGLR